ncbi:TPA: IS5/IS1182 family transposase, partial [Acinetobacter baumannii]|nr:IS5/IS1182 family transposase [Acinetobacter baumannii]
RTVKRLGRTLWKKWSGYHRRSLVETKMNCIKLLGDKLSARSFDSQVNEIHARVAVLNRFTELGRPLTQVTP